ncbi:hypothetical protein ACFPM7_02945 [Actinokineospora guangxiensis]|uniref:Uncharacterized protein n=1 Tax=Actinokineospora guangxiensis TaxID=1490288 RepID=A0ABW0EG82_9PSEU
MSFFGQVWLWSLAGFLVGALLCWLLVARPARRQIAELEDSLAEARRAAKAPEAGDRPREDYNDRQRDNRSHDDLQRDDHSQDYDDRHSAFGGAPAYDHDQQYDQAPSFDRADGPGFGRPDIPAFDRDDAPTALSAPAEATPDPVEPPAVAEAESTQLLSTPPVGQHPPVEAPPEVEPEWLPVAERFDVSQLDSDRDRDYGPRDSRDPHGTDDGPEFDVSQLSEGRPEDQHLVDDLPEDFTGSRAERFERSETDDDRPESGGTIFTQHTTPISRTLINRLDSDESLVDDLSDDDEHAADHDDEHSDPNRGRFAAALTPDDEEEYARQADESTAMTRYFPPIRPDAPDHDTSSHGAQSHDTVAVPRASRRADAGYADDLADDLADDFADDLADDAADRRPDEPHAAPAADGTRRTDASAHHAPAPHQDASPAEPAQAEPARPEAADPAALPKRTPGREVRRPVGESSAFTPTSRGLDMFTPATDNGAARPRHGLDPGPAAETRSAFTPSSSGTPAARPAPEPTVFAPSVPEPVAEAGEPAETATANGLLPKRVPKKPGDRFPFGVQTGAATSASASGSARSASSAASPAEPLAAESESDRVRSLFEPIVAADEAAKSTPPPAPARPRRGAATSALPSGGVDTFVPPGPFGPGSAMPLPGGNSPSGEYRVKASVTALRYCSPESPRFDRTVAEVWFRTVADAERVGFRPLG